MEIVCDRYLIAIAVDGKLATWADMSKGFEEAWQHLAEGFDKAWSEFRGKEQERDESK